MTAPVISLRTRQPIAPAPPKMTARIAELMAIAVDEDDDAAFAILHDAWLALHHAKLWRARA